jgi:hypothetical protein
VTEVQLDQVGCLDGEVQWVRTWEVRSKCAVVALKPDAVEYAGANNRPDSQKPTHVVTVLGLRYVKKQFLGIDWPRTREEAMDRPKWCPNVSTIPTFKQKVLVCLVGATVNALGLRLAKLKQVLHRMCSQESLVHEFSIAWKDILWLLHCGQLGNSLVIGVKVVR